MTITEFLLARIAEQEEAAREAMSIPEGVERSGSPDPLHGVPVADMPGLEPDEVGRWGWNGGPVVFDERNPEERMLRRVFGSTPDRPDEPYNITDSGLWDESEPMGAQLFRASVPARIGWGTARHIALHSPARVLAECKAKRAIVERVAQAVMEAAAETDTEQGWVTDAIAAALLATASDLASVYADHPDFDPAWTLT